MSIEWVTFTRRTADLKLSWLERALTARNIPNRRHGESAHAPILQVPAGKLDAAWEILTPELDEREDDDLTFSNPQGD